MSLPGPILVISDRTDRRLTTALSAAGAFPIVECQLAEAAGSIARVEPVAILFADPDVAPAQSLAGQLMDAIDAMPAPFMPVLARVNECGATVLDVLPIDVSAPQEQVIARLGAVLRVRALHATVLRRIDTLRYNGADVPQLAASDPLDDATVLVAGRGRSYPALAAAVGERIGVVGALSVETAARHLNNRDVNGIILGDGFGPPTIEAFLMALSADPRFRDLPVGVVPAIPPAFDRARLCGVEPVCGAPENIVAHMLPLVRVRAFASRLRRHVAALDARGMIDPDSGLSTIAAFERDLPDTILDAHERGVAMSMARIAFPVALGRRAGIDAARLVSRLIRNVDFACQDADGSIYVVFAESALRQAHVIARRIANVLRTTMIRDEAEASLTEATVTLASLKAHDTPQSLLERVSELATETEQPQLQAEPAQ